MLKMNLGIMIFTIEAGGNDMKEGSQMKEGNQGKKGRDSSRIDKWESRVVLYCAFRFPTFPFSHLRSLI